MNKKEKTELREMRIRQDLMFSVIANDYLGKQAMQVYTSVAKGVEAEPENEKLKEVAEKSIESYKFHSQNVNDAISYYYEIFGEEANIEVFDIMKERGIDRKLEEEMANASKEEPEPITKVNSMGQRTSEKG